MRFLLPVLLLFFAFATPPSYDEYNGGRPGYSFARLRLFTDSTYDFREDVHTMLHIRDRGTWKRDGIFFQLNSINRKGKTPRFPHFVKQQFDLNGDTLRFLPKNRGDADYYTVYYTFLKSHP